MSHLFLSGVGTHVSQGGSYGGERAAVRAKREETRPMMNVFMMRF